LEDKFIYFIALVVLPCRHGYFEEETIKYRMLKFIDGIKQLFARFFLSCCELDNPTGLENPEQLARETVCMLFNTMPP
jgi:hypothetical protein